MFTKAILKSVTGVPNTWRFFVLVIGALLAILSSPTALAQSVTDGFNLRTNNALPTTGVLADNMIYLPLVMNQFPFTPAAPVLDAIGNEDGNGNYTVSWSSSEGADTYTLQEDDNADFSSPTTAYAGASTSTAVSGRDVGTYYYRVQASNARASSDWSNLESVDVTVPLPDCPQAGNWIGVTSQGRQISFDVENSSQCQIVSDSLKIAFRDSCSVLRTTTFMYSVLIANNQFDTGVAAGTQVIGEFTTSSTVSGTFSYSSGSCTASGNWTAELNKGANDRVIVLTVQADGKILVGGEFTMLGGEARDRIGRLNADSTLDTTFNPGANDWIAVMALQPDGKILVGGGFTELGGQPRDRIARLNPDGTLDETFNPEANDTVNALAVQPDGKILVGGRFTILGGQSRDRIARLNPDGTLDESFNPGADGNVPALVVQPDGKILVGGFFNTLGGQPVRGLGRLNSDGTLDEAFSVSTFGIWGLALQSEGNILIWGYFVEVNWQAYQYIARLSADGTLDTSFNPVAQNTVRSVVVQSDGKIVIGGDFWYLGDWETRSYIGRLNADGTLDFSFNPGANDKVRAMVIQPDGKIMIGGDFTTLGGGTRAYIGRLNADGTLDPSFP